MKRLAIIAILFTLNARCIAQSIVPDSSSGTAFKSVVVFYNNSLGPELHLFNGKEYEDYNVRFSEGHPYFLANKWNKGTVTYDGNTYEDVSMLYNLATDNLIILDHSGVSKIQLIKEKVSSFSLSGHSFINIGQDSTLSKGLRPGFYDVLTTGNIALFARRTKNIQMATKDVVEIKVLSKDYFYLKTGNVYSLITNKNTLLKQLAPKRKEIQQFMKQNDIQFSQNPESAFVRIVEYYSLLTK